MAKKTVKEQQRARAEELRANIASLATGMKPSGAKPSPRELTDAAARAAWLRAQGRKKKPAAAKTTRSKG